MKWLIKIAWDIFGNKASMVFALLVVVPAIGTAVWKYNAWLDKRDEAVRVQIERDRYKEAAQIYADEYSRRLDLADKDQAAYANLQKQKQALEALADEAVGQLEKADAEGWSNITIPVFHQRVLLEYLKEAGTSDIQGDCAGTAAGCAADRLREILDAENAATAGSATSNQP